MGSQRFPRLPFYPPLAEDVDDESGIYDIRKR
jgi:hypothetical protein